MPTEQVVSKSDRRVRTVALVTGGFVFGIAAASLSAGAPPRAGSVIAGALMFVAALASRPSGLRARQEVGVASIGFFVGVVWLLGLTLLARST